MLAVLVNCMVYVDDSFKTASTMRSCITYATKSVMNWGGLVSHLLLRPTGVGGLAEAVTALSKLAGRLSIRNNELKSMKTIFSLYSRLGLTLVRANCRAILSRLT